MTAVIMNQAVKKAVIMTPVLKALVVMTVDTGCNNEGQLGRAWGWAKAG